MVAFGPELLRVGLRFLLTRVWLGLEMKRGGKFVLLLLQSLVLYQSLKFLTCFRLES